MIMGASSVPSAMIGPLAAIQPPGDILTITPGPRVREVSVAIRRFEVNT